MSKKRIYLEFTKETKFKHGSADFESVVEVYTVRKIIGSLDYNPTQRLTKEQVQELCDHYGTWEVHIEAPRL